MRGKSILFNGSGLKLENDYYLYDGEKLPFFLSYDKQQALWDTLVSGLLEDGHDKFVLPEDKFITLVLGTEKKLIYTIERLGYRRQVDSFVTSKFRHSDVPLYVGGFPTDDVMVIDCDEGVVEFPIVFTDNNRGFMLDKKYFKDFDEQVVDYFSEYQSLLNTDIYLFSTVDENMPVPVNMVEYGSLFTVKGGSE